MGISINTNTAALRNAREVSSSKRKVDEEFTKLSTGKRINKASDDPAGLAIALDMLSQADTGAVAARNISDGVSMANIADATLSTVSDITTRMSELATQASNGTLNDDQRAQLNMEYSSLRAELDRVSQNTEFNGQKLLSGDTSVTIQAGTSGDASSQVQMALPGVSSAALGLSADISTQAGAQQALDQAKAATQSVAASRGEIGASVARLGSAYENIKTSELNSRQAAGGIMDADIADSTSKLAAHNIRLQGAAAMLAQANTAPQLALALLR